MIPETIEPAYAGYPEFDFWRSALAGTPNELVVGKAESGFYRIKQRDAVALAPVAIWRDEHGLAVRIGGKSFRPKDELEFCERTFAWCAKSPVTRAQYDAFYADGRWFDEVPDVSSTVENRLNEISESFGHNAPPEMVISETIKELRAEAERWLKEIGGEVSTQEHANKASNFADRFAELAKEADSNRVTEKEPHLKASREVDGKWQPVKAAGDDAKRWAKGLTEKFLKAEHARKLQEAADRAAQGEAVKASDLKVKAGTRGRSVSLRTVKELRITDFETLWGHYVKDERFRKHPEVLKALGKMAEGDLGVGLNVPGAKIEEKQVAA